MPNSTQQKWDKIYSQAREQPAVAVQVVSENLHLAPSVGRGLELACGRAANSFAFARQGLEMDAWDISPVVIEQVNRQAESEKLSVRGAARDVVANPPESNCYDVVIVSRFLDRAMIAMIIDTLKPGGLLFYQTYTQTTVSVSGPKRSEWRLADGELLSMFAALHPVIYREEGSLGDVNKGLRNEAFLIARKAG